MTKPAVHYHSQERSVEELLFWWPTITRQASTDFAKGFAISIMAASRRRTWTPSAKQLGIMRRMVSDWFSRRGREDDDDLSVIE